MAKKITFNNHHKPEPFQFILSTRTKKHLGSLKNIVDSSIVYKNQMNGVNEISFTVYKILNNMEEPLWNDIQNLRLIYIPEINEYFEIQFSVDEKNNTEKRITGISLCEAELGQTILYDIEINTEKDIARDDYVATKFYDSHNQNASLLHRILEKAPHYSIKHVDDSLKNLQRSFSINGSSIYDFLTGDCAKEFNCLFQFDSTDRSVSVYDLYTVCMNNNCSYYLTNHQRYRGYFNDVCPECSSTNLYYYGNDTTIYVDSNNLTDEIQLQTNADEVKNTFKLIAGDDEMTAAIINNNPNGSGYLYYFSEETKNDMPTELVNKMNDYDVLYNSYINEYQTTIQGIYDSLDNLLYLESTMMPEYEPVETTASIEAAKLTQANLSPLGLKNVSSNTSVATVNSALKNYAKTIIYSGKYRAEVNTGSFQYVGTTVQGINYGYWTGNFIVTSYSDDTDTATSSNITVLVNDDYSNYLNQRIQKQISKDNESVDDNSIYDVLNIQDINTFSNEIKKYCLNRLNSFEDAVQSVLDILVEVDQASPGKEYYNNIYLPYIQKRRRLRTEIYKRKKSIQTEKNNYNNLILTRKTIQDALNFKNYLGNELYEQFCMYRREDSYENSNYISDGLNNTDIFKNANLFLESAKKEIKIAGTPQHTITSDLYNLMLLNEFQPIIDNFELGNFIRLKIDEELYRLRLSSYQINFSDLTRLNTEFSDLTKISTDVDAIKHTLESAKQMATSYSYVARQADKGSHADITIDDFRREGLNSALYKIKNADTEEITFDNHGLLGRSYDDITDTYLSKQVKLTHNVLAFTDDDWESVRLAIGETTYTLNGTTYEEYGVNADFMIAGTIVGGDIYSANYSTNPKRGTHIDLQNGTFSFAGDKLKYDGNILVITGTINATGGTFSGNITSTGTISGGTISGTTISGSTISGGTISGTTISGTNINGSYFHSETPNGSYVDIGNELVITRYQGEGEESLYVDNFAGIGQGHIYVHNQSVSGMSGHELYEIDINGNHIAMGFIDPGGTFRSAFGVNIGADESSYLFGESVVSVGSNDVYGKLNVYGEVNIGNNMHSGSLTLVGNENIAGFLNVTGHESISGSLNVGTDGANENLNVFGNLNVGNSNNPRTVNLVGTVNIYGELWVNGQRIA